LKTFLSYPSFIPWFGSVGDKGRITLGSVSYTQIFYLFFLISEEIKFEACDRKR